MSWLTTARSIAGALGVGSARVDSIGCDLGRRVYRETKRSTQIVNVHRRGRPLQSATARRLQPLYPGTDLGAVRVRTSCRLPPNRFAQDGSIYAMTFGWTIYFRDALDESDPVHLVHLIHELVHVDQARRLGSESSFACEYGLGYLRGGGDVPSFIGSPTAYHRNPLESEAYAFEERFRDERGRVDRTRLPAM